MFQATVVGLKEFVESLCKNMIYSYIDPECQKDLDFGSS